MHNRFPIFVLDSDVRRIRDHNPDIPSMARRIIRSAPLFALLLLVGCAEIDSILEYDGVIEVVATLEYEGNRQRGNEGEYLPVGLVEEGVILTEYDAFVPQYGAFLTSLAGKRIRNFGGGFGGYRFRDVRELVVSSDGTMMAVAGIVQQFSANGVIVYDVETSDLVAGMFDVPSGLKGPVGAIAFDSHHDMLGVGYGGGIAIFPLDDPFLREDPIVLHGGSVLGTDDLDFSPTDPDRLVTPDGIWSIAAGKIIVSFDERNLYFRTVHYSADGEYILAGGSHGFHLIDAETGEEVGNLRDIDGPDHYDNYDVQPTTILSIDVTSDGIHAVSGATDGLVTVWEIATGRIVARDSIGIMDVVGVQCSGSDPNRFLTATVWSVSVWDMDL